MVFSSVSFLLYFLPVFLAAYYIIPNRFRRYVLLAGSLAFYVIGCFDEPVSICLLLVTGAVNYFGARKFGPECPKRMLFFGLTLFWNIGLLFVFKYAGFFAPGLSLGLLLPLGISFYTFSLISYDCDVYRGAVKAEEDPVDFACWMLYFPKLTSGPITRYDQLEKELKEPLITKDSILEGARLFSLGLCLKVFLANQLGNLWNDINAIGVDSVSTALAWMGLIGYSLQLYFDFWGYSLMAMGLADMLGHRLPNNFNTPYMSLSMTEFWRRWHITLGGWFKDYIYIPLGGNRKGRKRTILNTLVVWLLTGLWHGADWNFLLWGLLLFVIMTIEKAGLKERLDSNKAAGHIYMMLLIPLTWMIFAISDMYSLKTYALRLIGLGALNVYKGDWITSLKTYWWLLLLGLLLSTGFGTNFYRHFKEKKWFWGVIALALGLSGYCLYMGMNDPFMYFRF